MSAYDDALRSLAASEGIEYVDCRVQSGWGVDSIPRLRVVEPTTAEPVVEREPEPILLRSPYEQLKLDPRYREAGARGLRIHEAALTRAEEKGISYAEALSEEIG